MPIKNAVVEINGQRFQLYPEGKKEGKLVEYQFDRKPNVKITVTYTNETNAPLPIRLRITPPGFDKYYNLTAKPGDNTFTYTYKIEEAYPVNVRSSIAVAAYVKKDTEFRYEPKFWAAYFTPKVAPVPPKVMITKIEHAPTVPLVTQKIQVIAYLKNPGTTQAADTLLLEVMRDGEVVKTERLPVTIKPLSSHIVEFPNFTLPAGVYNFKVTVKGTGETKTIPNVEVREAMANIKVNSLTPEKTQYQPGERIRLTAEVQNYGTAPGRKTLTVMVDGRVDHTITVTVREGEILRQPIVVRIEKQGYHNVCVDGKCARVLVGAPTAVEVTAPEITAPTPEVTAPEITAPTPEVTAPEVTMPEITMPTVECAPGDVLKGIYVKVENGQYVVYVSSGGLEIPVAYTNRNLTYLVPIPATTGLTMMDFDPTKIADVTQYRNLYNAIVGVRSVIQDNLVFIKGKSAYAVKIDEEEKCLSASAVRFFLEQLQDRYIIDLVKPMEFKPGVIKLPTAIPAKAKRLIPIEVGVPEAERERLRRAEEERRRLEEERMRRLEEERRRLYEEYRKQMEEYQKKLEEYKKQVEEAKKKAQEEVEKATEEAKTRAEEEVEKAKQAATVTEVRSAIRGLISQLEDLESQAKSKGMTDVVTTIENTLKWAREELSKRTDYASLMDLLNRLKATIDTVVSRMKRAAAAKPSVTLPYNIRSSIDDAIRALKSASQTISAAKSKISDCQKVGVDVSELRSKLSKLETAYDTLLNEVYSKLGTLGRAVGVSVTKTLSGIEAAYNSIKRNISVVGMLPQNIPSPIPREYITNVVVNTRDVQILVDRLRCVPVGVPGVPGVPTPTVPTLPVPVKLAVWKPPRSFELKARVIAPPGSDVTVYWSTCPLWGGCATTIPDLRARGRRVSGRANNLGVADFTLETRFLPATSYVYAFAEVRYRGTVTQTPVVSGGGPLGLSMTPPTPPVPTAPTVPTVPTAPTVPTPTLPTPTLTRRLLGTPAGTPTTPTPTAPTVPTPTRERKLLGLPAPTATTSEVKTNVRRQLSRLEELERTASAQGKTALVSEIEKLSRWAESESSTRTNVAELSDLQSRLQQATAIVEKALQLPPWSFTWGSVELVASQLRKITGWK